MSLFGRVLAGACRPEAICQISHKRMGQEADIHVLSGAANYLLSPGHRYFNQRMSIDSVKRQSEMASGQTKKSEKWEERHLGWTMNIPIPVFEYTKWEPQRVRPKDRHSTTTVDTCVCFQT